MQLAEIKSISIKTSLQGEIIPFLQVANMECLITQQAIVELTNKIVHYQEEGHPLFPEVFIIDDLELIAKVLTPFECYRIGESQKTSATMMTALKKCAPLTGNGWAIYVLRKPDSFEYGIFRSGSSILSISSAEALIDRGSPEIKAILIHQIAERVVEIRNYIAKSIIVDYGSGAGYKHETSNEQNEFINAIVSKVDFSIRDQITNFYYKVFSNVIQRGHGTLACVIDYKRKVLPERLQDGIILTKRIDVASQVYERNSGIDDAAADSKLLGTFSLISGMMLSDGITIFTNNGSVFAYNVFIKHSQKMNKTSNSGGARTRTYLSLCEMVGKDLQASFIQSQDGKIEFKGNGK